jgi:hypothetical protein
MGGDASEALGAREVAGTFVMPKGMTRRMTGVAAAGVVGGVVGGMVAQGASAAKRYEGAPDFGTLGYVAVTDGEVAIVRGKRGLLSPRVGDEVVARAARSDIASAELDPGALKAALRIAFADGGWWEFEVPKVNRKTAQAVVRALGGSAG